MKQKFFVLFILAVAVFGMTACATTGATPAAPAANAPEAGDAYREVVEEVPADPPYPISFDGDMNNNALISGAVKYQGVDGGYGRLVGGINRDGCIRTSDDALGRTIETIVRYADGVSMPDLCIGNTLAAMLNRSGVQIAQMSLRPTENGDVIIAKIDGREIANVSVDGLLYAADKVEATGVVPDWVTENAQLAVDIKTLSGLSDIDLAFYSDAFVYAHPSDVTSGTYTITQTIVESVYITDTLTSGSSGATMEVVIPDPAAMVTTTNTVEVDMEERVDVVWPEISYVTKQAAAAPAAVCYVIVQDGEGPLNTSARVARADGLTADQKHTLEGELTAVHDTGTWFAGQRIEVSCPADAVTSAGNELGK